MNYPKFYKPKSGENLGFLCTVEGKLTEFHNISFNHKETLQIMVLQQLFTDVDILRWHLPGSILFHLKER